MLNLSLDFLPFVLLTYLGSLLFTWWMFSQHAKLEVYLPKRTQRIRWYFSQELKTAIFFALYGSVVIVALDITRASTFVLGVVSFLSAWGIGYLRAYFHDGDMAIMALCKVVETIAQPHPKKRLRLKWLRK